MKVRTQSIILIAVASVIVICCMTAVICKVCEPTQEAPQEEMTYQIVDDRIITSFEYEENGVKKVQTAYDGMAYRVFTVKITNVGRCTAESTFSDYRYDATLSTNTHGRYFGMEEVSDLTYKYAGPNSWKVTVEEGKSATITLLFDASATFNHGTLYTFDKGQYEVIQ